MSLLDPDNGSAEMEESPDPEEDSGLPQRHQLDGESLDIREDEDFAEEDLAITQEIIDSHAKSMPVDCDECSNIVIGNSDINDNSAGNNDERDSRAVTVSTAEFIGLGEQHEDQIQNPMTLSDESIFKDGDPLCAVECASRVTPETCCESDMKLLHSNETLPSHFGISTLNDVNEVSELQAVKCESDLPRELKNLTDGSLNDGSSHTNFQSSCIVPSTVEIENILNDTDEAGGSNLISGKSSYVEGGSSFCDYQEISATLENSQNTALACLEEQLEKADVDIDIINTENIPCGKNSAMYEDVSCDMLDPACDTETVPPNNPVNSACLDPHAEITAELASLVEDSHDNFPSYPPITARQEVPDARWSSVSYDNAQPVLDLGTVDSCDDLSAAISPCEAVHNLQTSHVFEYERKTTVIAKPFEDKVRGSHTDSSSSAFDGSSTPVTGCSPVHQQNNQHADISNHIHLPQEVSYHKQGKTDEPAGEQPYLHTSTPTQESYKVVNSTPTDKVENEPYSNSAYLLPSEVAVCNTSEQRDSDLNVGDHTQATELGSSNCSDNSLYFPATLPNTFISNVDEPPNSNSSSQMQTLESASDDSSTASSQQSSPTKSLSSALSVAFNQTGKEQSSLLQTGNEYEILQDLHALLLAYASGTKSPHVPATDKQSGQQDSKNIGHSDNGLQPLFDIGQVQEYNRQLLQQMKIRDDEIAKLTSELSSIREAGAHGQPHVEEQILSSSHQADDLYLPQIKVLEHTISQQQKEIQALKLKLVSQDDAAKKAITSLQNELKSRVSQVTKAYEECQKEKDMIVIRFAESEAKNMEAKRIAERSEAKVKEVLKDREVMMNALKAAKTDRQKALGNFETKCVEIGNLQKEIEKLKEAINSSDHRTKWFQSKFSAEVEDHKETKSNLEKTVVKLKEAREETEVIRKECHAIVKRYQESEEIKSNSLDKELKLKETELRTQLQERNDNEEIHQVLKRELDSLKAQHKDTIEEAKTYKDKVHCLEEERQQNHQMIENYQEIMQRQKTSNAELNAKITSLSSLEEDYKRSQEMLNTVEADISELRSTNLELQKDMDSCRERESKMLSLQSELSHTNALLRSENTSLNNKISALTRDLEKLKKEVQAFEITVKDLTGRCDKERAKRIEEGDKMAAILAERTKECNDLKQKWEDEMDNSKTLKRRHTSNIKDLTRQLHQVHKRLESIEGKGDAGSMGSRTNSNGSLNSLENSSRQTFPINHPPVQEFPAITEQVEVDKQVLIERIVRLQKSHARKNEKLEFLGEHIQQLLEDIKKKNKVIQCYALREESGTLSSEDMDANKTLLARKGGIMASLYSAQQQDGTMTLDLSLQISRKLQAVLEDTLLKNITLKESLDTLGEEIARLSQENRKLQLHLQKIEGNLA